MNHSDQCYFCLLKDDFISGGKREYGTDGHQANPMPPVADQPHLPARNSADCVVPTGLSYPSISWQPTGNEHSLGASPSGTGFFTCVYTVRISMAI